MRVMTIMTHMIGVRVGEAINRRGNLNRGQKISRFVALTSVIQFAGKLF